LHKNPDASDKSILKATGIHWRGTMYMRYLGMITKDKSLTLQAISFYKNPTLRNSVLQQQLEKWYYCVDEFFKPGDKTYSVYPFFVLLKVLLEIGKKTKGSYSISIDEFKYFVLTIRHYKGWKTAVGFILKFRGDVKSRKLMLDDIFSNTSYDRILFLIELSDIFKITKKSISIIDSKLRIAKKKIKTYEELEHGNLIPNYHKNHSRYLKLLYSNESLFEFCENEKNIDQVVMEIESSESRKKVTERDELKIEQVIEEYIEKLTTDQLKNRIAKILQRRKYSLSRTLRSKYRKQTSMSDKEAIKLERTIGKLIANYYGCCQIVGCGFTFPKGRDGRKGTYCEAHHLQTLAGNGKDVPENILVLCANHHRQFHFDDAKISKRERNYLVAELSGKKFRVNIDYPF
jgi:predicted restriction endonuclease